MGTEDTADSTNGQSTEHIRQFAENASKTVKDSFDTAQEYIKRKSLDFDFREFIRREPWLTVAAAFAIGYVAAQIIRRVT